MIVYLRKKGGSLDLFLRDWAASLAPRLHAFKYDELRSWEEFPSATYVFTDFSNLNAEQTAWVARLWDRLARGPVPVRLLNDPRRVLGRYALLRMLHERGINSHRAYHLREAHRARFPVFLRSKRTIRVRTSEGVRKHLGVTRLLWSRRELARAVGWWARRGWPTEELLVVEFVDTADADGLYPKYGAYYLAGRVIPRDLVFRSGWMVKSARHGDVPKHLALEREYLETNPHQSWIRDVFSAAHADYGRIDYGMHEGRPTIWEINTHAAPVGPAPIPPYLSTNMRRFAEAFSAAFEELDIDKAARG